MVLLPVSFKMPLSFLWPHWPSSGSRWHARSRRTPHGPRPSHRRLRREAAPQPEDSEAGSRARGKRRMGAEDSEAGSGGAKRQRRDSGACFLGLPLWRVYCIIQSALEELARWQRDQTMEPWRGDSATR